MMSRKHESMFSVLSDLESYTVEMDDIQNLLMVFDELIDSETEKIRNDQTITGHAAIFAARLPLIVSTLSVIRFRLAEVHANMVCVIQAGHELRRKASDGEE